MKTVHTAWFADARAMPQVADESVALVVTSPPYPMIEMWDEVFRALSPAAGTALDEGKPDQAFEAMHAELDRVWAECHRVLVAGGIAAVNIGDATRSVGGEFRLYPNHARVIAGMARAGFVCLPDILWRKPTNSPNKFMGSGMYPAGAYVTYEHEYVLLFRKGAKRVFRGEDKRVRRRSAYFWEERNAWFSDLWTDLCGTRQALCDRAHRDRSGAFPFEIPWRLVQMYSCYGDTVLDPFAGTGTTLAAALASGRNSVGIERDPSFATSVESALRAAVEVGAARVRARLVKHRAFVADHQARGKPLKHHNAPHDVPVVTRQEVELALRFPVAVRKLPAQDGALWFEADYEQGEPPCSGGHELTLVG